MHSKDPKNYPGYIKRQGYLYPLPSLHSSGYIPTYPEYSLDIPVPGSSQDIGVYKLFTTR
jgi:hypothetical protein